MVRRLTEMSLLFLVVGCLPGPSLSDDDDAVDDDDASADDGSVEIEWGAGSSLEPLTAAFYWTYGADPIPSWLFLTSLDDHCQRFADFDADAIYDECIEAGGDDDSCLGAVGDAWTASLPVPRTWLRIDVRSAPPLSSETGWDDAWGFIYLEHTGSDNELVWDTSGEGFELTGLGADELLHGSLNTEFADAAQETAVGTFGASACEASQVNPGD